MLGGVDDVVVVFAHVGLFEEALADAAESRKLVIVGIEGDLTGLGGGAAGGYGQALELEGSEVFLVFGG